MGSAPASMAAPPSTGAVGSGCGSSPSGRQAPTRHSKPLAHSRPQLPQWLASCPRLTQTPSHATNPRMHSPPTIPLALHPVSASPTNNRQRTSQSFTTVPPPCSNPSRVIVGPQLWSPRLPAVPVRPRPAVPVHRHLVVLAGAYPLSAPLVSNPYR